jgi:dTDP-4-amino-4,6-dideoxygalactose transaminase
MLSHGVAGVGLPGTEEAAATNLAVPISPMLGPEQAAEVVTALRVPALA